MTTRGTALRRRDGDGRVRGRGVAGGAAGTDVSAPRLEAADAGSETEPVPTPVPVRQWRETRPATVPPATRGGVVELGHVRLDRREVLRKPGGAGARAVDER